MPIWYWEVSSEIVDDNSTEEKELVDAINSAIKSTCDQCDTLADNWLENLSKDQLSMFLIKNYFDWWVKSYSQCLSTWKFLNFSMKAALQLLSEGDTWKYDDNWNITSDENWRSIDDIIKWNWWIDLDSDTVLIKILQNKVWAVADWKPWPQTIAMVVSALGGDVSNIYEWVNNLYSKNEKFRIQNVTEFTIWDKNYKYDQNQFNLTTVEWKIILTVKWEQNWREVAVNNWNPTLNWFTFENWWIKKNQTDNLPNANNDLDWKTLEELWKDLDYLKRYYSNCNVFVVKQWDSFQYYALNKWNINSYFSNSNINSWWTIPLWYMKSVFGTWYNWVSKSMDISWSFAWYDINYTQVKSLIDGVNDIDMSDSNLLKLADTHISNKSWWREKNRRKLAKWCLSNDERWWKKFVERWNMMKEKWLAEGEINLKTWMLLCDKNIDNIVC